MASSIKQVIVIRRDLKMRRGKEIAQGAHAAMAFLTRKLQQYVQDGQFSLTPAQEAWTFGLFAKVVVQVESEAELLAVHTAALVAGIESHVITDMGLTEFHGVPTVTACALGPEEAEKLDAITRELKLY